MGGLGGSATSLTLILAVIVGFSVAKETDIRADVGTTASLPCKVDKEQCGQLHSLKWYKDADRVYVLSHAGQGRAEGDATERMDVKYDSNSSDAFLNISPVKGEDEATYKCEITYLEVHDNCDVVQIVNLVTLQKPTAVKILVNGTSIKNGTVVGPQKEGDEVDLLCMAVGGKPIPRVRWYNGSVEIKRAIYQTSDEENGFGTGTSKLKLTLSRGDLLSRFECIVDSNALDDPIVSWISMDVHVRPTKIELSGVKKYVVQGTNVLLNCDVYGARPKATIRWANGTSAANESLVETDDDGQIQIRTFAKQERDGTFTTKSSLKFTASHWENGKTFYCFAENEVIMKNMEPELRANIILDVRHPPIITMSPLNVTINETAGTSVVLKCNYFANPQELKDVIWSKDGRNLTLSGNPKYVGGTVVNPALSINNVTRDDMGEYVCFLKNEIGSETAENSIYLNVQYPPSVELIMNPATPIKSVEKSNVYLECNITTANPPVLLKVRWFLDGEIMKEVPECNYTNYNEKGEGEGYGGPFCGLDPSILSLERVDETFAGNYTCQGKNADGWGPESEPKELIVYYPPRPAKLKSYPSKVVKGASVKLECTVDHPGRPDRVKYIWSRGSHRISEANSTIEISPVRLETRNNFTCIVENEGGQSLPDTIYVNVSAPPAFIQKLPPYQGVLYNSENVNLTCIVECYPKCSIVWKKNGSEIDPKVDRHYKIVTSDILPNISKNDFESINSTLIWNVASLPAKQLDKSGPNLIYTCESKPNEYGAGVSSSIEIAVDYPPEEMTVSPSILDVVEKNTPSSVKCSGKGLPALNYLWKNPRNEVLTDKNELHFGTVNRSHSGSYVCEASNKHGKSNISVQLNVQYAPECTLVRTKKDSRPALECTIHANPTDVKFVWKVKESNETFLVTSNVLTEGLRSYLFTDSGMDSARTYYCIANNSIGVSTPCEKDVTGAAPWWNQEKMIIIIGSIIAIIIIVIIICVIIIMLCRRKRADTKYNNPLEMEERENPDGHYPIISDQSKWPLQPGVLVHVSKLNHVSISQLSSRMAPFKSTSVAKASDYFRSRRKSKVYARLERLKELLGVSRGRHHVPEGIKESETGVVSFKRVNRSIPPTRPPGVANSRKRKKPGSAPNPSSIEDKARLGAAPPLGGTADPLSDPDKGFYENLPFHGMQNPPNKPISVIAPFNQGNNAQSFTSSTKSLQPPTKTPLSAPFGSLSTNVIANKQIKRHQSFNGFQNGQTPLTNLPPFYPLTGHFNNAFVSSNTSQHFRNFQGYFPSNTDNRFIPSIFSQLPPNFGTSSGYNTVPGIPVTNNYNTFHTTQSGQLNRRFGQRNFNSLTKVNPFTIVSPTNRIVGRNEAQFDIRRTASGINPSPNTVPKEISRANPTAKRRTHACKKLAAIPEKRFGSLEIKKHKCYSPTFYSMRCKKHIKRRSIVVAIPKKSFSDIEEVSNNGAEQKEDYQNLTDSIQILEENSENLQIENSEVPVPAPRGKNHRKSEIVYANLSASLNKCESITEDSNSSEDAIKNEEAETSITEVQVHVSNDAENSSETREESSVDPVDTVDGTEENKENVNGKTFRSTPVKNKNTNSVDATPKLIAVSPKQTPKIIMSSHALKNSPTLKVSPNFIKPKTESPKGALSLQIKAKIKASPIQSPSDNPNKTILSNSKEEDKANGQFPNIPQMPILSTQNKWSPNNTNVANQNAFYTLTTPHFKQLNSIVPPQYSATIPHQKHVKLIPKALFQEQLPKSKSFSSKSKQKKHNFQIPLQKCHSFKFQTAESYFQPIKNIHEENLMRNGYVSDYPESSGRHGRHHKRDKPKQKTKGPLVLRRPSDYQENVHFQENMQNSVQLQYPQPMLGRSPMQGAVASKPNGVVYADLDMPSSNSKKSTFDLSSSKPKSQKSKPKTEYATLKFNDVGQEIDV